MLQNTRLIPQKDREYDIDAIKHYAEGYLRFENTDQEIKKSYLKCMYIYLKVLSIENKEELDILMNEATSFITANLYIMRHDIKLYEKLYFFANKLSKEELKLKFRNYNIIDVKKYVRKALYLMYDNKI